MGPGSELAHGRDIDGVRAMHAQRGTRRQPCAQIGQRLMVTIGPIRADDHWLSLASRRTIDAIGTMTMRRSQRIARRSFARASAAARGRACRDRTPRARPSLLPRVPAVERDRPRLAVVDRRFPELADAAVGLRLPADPLQRALAGGPASTTSPRSVIAPSTNPPSSISRLPPLSTHVWCHFARSRSKMLRLDPVTPPLPRHSSSSAQPLWMRVMRFSPTRLPDGSCTSHSPTQKSNWRCSGAAQGCAGVGVRVAAPTQPIAPSSSGNAETGAWTRCIGFRRRVDDGAMVARKWPLKRANSRYATGPFNVPDVDAPSARAARSSHCRPGPATAGLSLRALIHRSCLDAIVEGRIAPGDRLPSARQLASDWRVSRNTVDDALAALQAEGCWSAASVPERSLRRAPPARDARLASRGRRALSAATRSLQLSRWSRDAAVVHAPGASPKPQAFIAGLPDVELFPHELWRRLIARRLRTSARALAGYLPSLGLPALQEATARHLAAARGLVCDPGRSSC